MFIGIETVKTQHERPSKTGRMHFYIREKTLALFRCDNCDADFKRELKKMDRKRLNNNYFHCCSDCDSKRFGQRKGVERKKIWDLLASTTLPIGKY
jgi:hypothetical protein